MNPLVVAFATTMTHPGAQRWLASCARWGWAYFAIVGPWRGWGGRLRQVLAYAETARRDGFTHLVHTDMWDVIALGPPSELGEALDRYARPPLLLAVEAGCWPDGTLAPRYEPRLLPWWYPHSQFVIDLSQPFPVGVADVDDAQDDQRHFHQLVLAGTPGLVLDRQCAVFQSIAHSHPWPQFFALDGDPMLGQARRLANVLTGTRPLFAHGNGGTDMAWLAPCGA